MNYNPAQYKFNNRPMITQMNNNFDPQTVYHEIDNDSEIVSICSYCKNMKMLDGQWEKSTLPHHNAVNTLLSHGICPSCAQKHFPKEYQLAILKNT